MFTSHSKKLADFDLDSSYMFVSNISNTLSHCGPAKKAWYAGINKKHNDLS